MLFQQAKVHFDFEINIGDDVIPVHRFVLAACSDYIDKMMRRQKNMSNLLLSPHTIRTSTVQLILDLIYTGMTNMLRGVCNTTKIFTHLSLRTNYSYVRY